MIQDLVLAVGDDTVTARLEGDVAVAEVGVVLAHGAGAGQDHPWMASMRRLLAEQGLPTLTFNYMYTQVGRKSPDRPARLLPVHAAAVDLMRRSVDRVVLAGKSMGGRIAAHVVGDVEPAVMPGPWLAGMVYYGYPLVPLGKAEPRPVDHLHRIAVPQLFFAGSKDRLSPPDKIASLAASLPAASMVVIDDGDHSFKVPKRTGRTNDEILGELATTTADWISTIE